MENDEMTKHVICDSCGAPIHKDPAEGEGLPCGH